MIPTVTKESLNTALESSDVVIEEDVVQEAATTAVSISVSTTGDAVAPVLTVLSATVKAEVAADTGIDAANLVVVESEVVVEATTVKAAPTAAPVAADGMTEVTISGATAPSLAVASAMFAATATASFCF